MARASRKLPVLSMRILRREKTRMLITLVTQPIRMRGTKLHLMMVIPRLAQATLGSAVPEGVSKVVVRFPESSVVKLVMLSAGPVLFAWKRKWSWVRTALIHISENSPVNCFAKANVANSCENTLHVFHCKTDRCTVRKGTPIPLEIWCNRMSTSRGFPFIRGILS